MAGKRPANTIPPFGATRARDSDAATDGRGRRLRPTAASGPSPGTVDADTERTFELRIDLDGTDPPIWRTFTVPDEIRLDELHHVLQLVMGWTNSHLHEFQRGGARYGDLEGAFEEDDLLPEEEHLLAELLTRPRQRLSYLYDFGDGWQHTLRLKAVREEPCLVPRCLAGEGACPPEDCGGVGGYAELLEILADPRHPEHHEIREWYRSMTPEGHDPAVFPIDAVDAQLAKGIDAIFEAALEAEEAALEAEVASLRRLGIEPDLVGIADPAEDEDGEQQVLPFLEQGSTRESFTNSSVTGSEITDRLLRAFAEDTPESRQSLIAYLLHELEPPSIDDLTEELIPEPFDPKLMSDRLFAWIEQWLWTGHSIEKIVRDLRASGIPKKDAQRAVAKANAHFVELGGDFYADTRDLQRRIR